MKFTTPLFALLAAASAFTSPVKRGNGECRAAIENTGCPVLNINYNNEKSVLRFCSDFQSGKCQELFKTGVKGLKDCEDLDPVILEQFEKHANGAISQLEKLCQKAGGNDSSKPTTTPANKSTSTSPSNATSTANSTSTSNANTGNKTSSSASSTTNASTTTSSKSNATSATSTTTVAAAAQTNAPANNAATTTTFNGFLSSTTTTLIPLSTQTPNLSNTQIDGASTINRTSALAVILGTLLYYVLF